ncbi:MAG TPA: ABC transporter family substrate-binding protein [Micropruina sp.]|nr:ABC transporter family substrate-binding protein [Micropruina sp.]
MGTKKWFAGAAGLIAAALALSACTPPAANSTATAPAASNVSVMWNQPFYSVNQYSTSGNNLVNANVGYLITDTMTYYGEGLNLVNNKSFGTYEKLSDSPLKVKVTLADTATWSDGVPVTAADLVLYWATYSGAFNTLSDDEVKKDQDTGAVTSTNKGSDVYFDQTGVPAFSLVKDFPVIGDNGKSVTYTYSKPFADWEKNLMTAGLPAHVVGTRALGETDATKAADDVVKAFQNKDNATLSKISNVWNKDWNFKNKPADANLLVSCGPYVISDAVADQYLTLTKNPNYKGDHKPSIDTITIRFNEDPMAGVQALQNGEVQLISPQVTEDAYKAAKALTNATTITGIEGSYEHIDLSVASGGAFDPKTYGGDAAKALKVKQAFLHVVPRQKIVDTLVKPVNPDAAVRNSFNAVPGAPDYEAVSSANGMGTTYGDVDVAKAKQLLSEAGVTSPTVRIMFAKQNVRRQGEFRLIKETAEEAGFKIVDSSSDYWSTLVFTAPDKYDVAFFAWISNGTGVTDVIPQYKTKKLGGSNNPYGFSNKQVDDLYDQLQVETDPAKQTEILKQVDKLLVDNAFGLTIFQFPSMTSYSNKLSGIKPIAITPTIFWNFWEWKIS